MSAHGRQLPHKRSVIAAVNLLDANVQTVLYRCSHFLRKRERLVQNMCRHLQCEKVSIEVWGGDVSLCQGYVAIWPALAMIRLKYKVL